MKAPDKLFLHPNYMGEVGANWLTFPLTEKDECYIRKDALLEWAEEEMMKAAKQSDSYGRRNAFMDVIDKIESL